MNVNLIGELPLEGIANAFNYLLELFEQEDYSGVIVGCETVLERYPRADEFWHLLGGAYFMTEKRDLAISALMTALKFSPADAVYLLDFVCISAESGLSKLSVEHLNRTFEFLKPEDRETLLELISDLIDDGKFKRHWLTHRIRSLLPS